LIAVVDASALIDLFSLDEPELDETLAERVWSLRHNLGAYDACFIALAESLDVPLITCDDKQAAASGHYAHVLRFGS
jgi:predicted nucleic acid-binding protein